MFFPSGWTLVFQEMEPGVRWSQVILTCKNTIVQPRDCVAESNGAGLKSVSAITS